MGTISKALVRAAPTIVSSITPLAFLTPPAILVGLKYSVINLNLKVNRVIIASLGLWSAAEIGFYLYCWRLKKKFEPKRKFPELTREERKTYHMDFVEQCPDIWSILTGWYPTHDPEDIGYEALQEYLSWAYFSKGAKELTPEESEEMVEYMTLSVEKCPRLAKRSPHLQLRSMKPNLDPLLVRHKPLVIAGVIALAKYYGNQALQRMGFRHHSLPGGTTLSYWHFSPRYGKTSTKLPVFMVHGIGIGIGMYIGVVKSIRRLDPDREIILLSLPHISLELVDRIPSMEQTLEDVDTILERHGLKSCSWLAHSYGTIVTAWVIKERPKYVDRVCLVDPTCFALWESDLIYKFLYREPRTPIHNLVQFFIARDLLVAYTLFRNFWWVENLLKPVDINCPAKVYLSSQDSLINCDRVSEHLEQNQNPLIEVEKMSGLQHGGFRTARKFRSRIVQSL
jgi:pimeloyl-ACP methyl ester carboxylesterase